MAFDRRTIPGDVVEGRWEAADGHSIRRIDWPRPDGAKGSILFVPGRGDNYEKYLETLEYWGRSGWAVTGIDWRGQGASGRLGNDEVTGHVEDFADWLADLKHFWTGWVASTPAPHFLIGHSMGGHLSLRAVADNVVTPDGLVLSAPMLGFIGAVPDPIGHAAAKLMTKIGDPKRQAWKWSEKPGEMPAMRAQLLTHDPDRYADEQWWRDNRPEIVMGPGSWGWVERAYASIRHLFARGRLERVSVPTFMFGTSNDKLVSWAAIKAAAARMPNAELLAFGNEAHHEILREVDPVRDRALAGIDAFLEQIAEQE